MSYGEKSIATLGATKALRCPYTFPGFPSVCLFMTPGAALAKWLPKRPEFLAILCCFFPCWEEHVEPGGLVRRKLKDVLLGGTPQRCRRSLVLLNPAVLPLQIVTTSFVVDELIPLED